MSSLSTNARTLTGIISFDDGAGGVLEGGVLTSDHVASDTSEISNLDVDSLIITTELLVNSTSITPTWLSYLYGLTGNIQTQIGEAATAVLSATNIWTGSQTFRNGVVNLIFQNTSASFPTRSSTYIGAIYGYVANPYALTFMNANSNLTSSNTAFAFEKMDTSSSCIQLVKIQNNGSITTVGSLISPTITSINSSLATDASNIATNTSNITTINSTLIVNTADIATNTADINTINTVDLPSKQGLITGLTPLSANVVGGAYAGSVSDLEYSQLAGVSSNIQTQLNGKQDSITSGSRLSATLIGANGNVSDVEYGYLAGVTSDIQTQINSVSTNIDPINILPGTITSTEFGRLNGVTSNVQTQINSINTTLSTDITCDTIVADTISSNGVVNYQYRQASTIIVSGNTTFTWGNLVEYIIVDTGGYTITLPNAGIAGHLGAVCYVYLSGDHSTTVRVTSQNIRYGTPSPSDQTSFLYTNGGQTKRFVVQNFIWTVMED